MHEFSVQTGNLKITIIAESARDAALEAVQVWEACSSDDNRATSDAAHRAQLDPLTIVRQADRRGLERRFPTFNLLAYSHHESPQVAWERVLRGSVGGVN